MLNVFLTIDTEFSRARCNGDTAANIDNDIYGKTESGEYGIAYQIDVLNQHGLSGVFFVESLGACVTGLDPLRRIVELIQDNGHEVQLHLHSEWLRLIPQPLLPGGRTGQHMRDFDLDDQTRLIAKGLENLRAAGARNVCAFRAGSYGANFDTLRALARNGLRYDTSHNTCYLGAPCELRTGSLLLQPAMMEGVHEFPVSFFQDWPGHFRHVQLAACSGRELENALIQAERRGWQSLVLVSHSFELIRRASMHGKPAAPDRIMIRRFEHLCRFLASERRRFRTVGFCDFDPAKSPQGTASVARPLKSNLWRTAGRVAEQLLRRL